MSTDTLSMAQDLARAGFTREQAEGVANAVHKAVREDAATKADIARLEAKIESVEAKFESVDAKFESVEAKIETVEAKTGAAIANAKQQVILAVVAVGGVIVGLLKLLP